MPLTLNQLLFRVFHEKDNMLQPARSELGLGRGQPRLLSFLLENGTSTQSDIADSLGIDPAAVSRMTKILDDKGFLIRTADKECRRSNRVELTDKGRKTAEAWREECRIIDQRILEEFSEEEADELMKLLQKLLGSLTRIKS